MFSDIFVKFLQENNLTAYKVAKETGISQSLMNRYKNGDQLPEIKNLIKIADCLNVSIDFLVGRTDDPHFYR